MQFNTPFNKSVFVTGATGLLGSHVIIALVNKGYTVSAFYRTEIPSPLNKKINWIQGDILDVIALDEVLQNVDEVYHCAAIVSFSPDDVDHMFKTNIEGTENVVNACVANNVSKLCYVSSVAALGRIIPNPQKHRWAGLWWMQRNLKPLKLPLCKPNPR